MFQKNIENYCNLRELCYNIINKKIRVLRFFYASLHKLWYYHYNSYFLKYTNWSEFSLLLQPWTQMLEKNTPLSSSSMLFKKLSSVDSVCISNIETGAGENSNVKCPTL